MLECAECAESAKSAVQPIWRYMASIKMVSCRKQDELWCFVPLFLLSIHSFPSLPNIWAKLKDHTRTIAYPTYHAIWLLLYIRVLGKLTALLFLHRPGSWIMPKMLLPSEKKFLCSLPNAIICQIEMSCSWTMRRLLSIPGCMIHNAQELSVCRASTACEMVFATVRTRDE